MTAAPLERAPPRRRYRRMEELTLSPRGYAPPRRALREPAAWALPPVERFDGRAANDGGVEPLPAPEIPRWVVVLAGAVFAAALGALLGGALAV